MNEKLEQCLVFIAELEKLKSIARKVMPKGLDRYENSAEHSWQAAMLAFVAAPFANEPVDTRRAALMMLVHDVGEIDAGDTFFFDSSGRDDAKARELACVERIFSMLPAETAAECLELWHEFDSGETPEAKFARAIDRVLPMLQNVNNGGQSWRENGIGKDQILSRTAYIAQGSEDMWELIKSKVEGAFGEKAKSEKGEE